MAVNRTVVSRAIGMPLLDTVENDPVRRHVRGARNYRVVLLWQ